MYVRRLPQKQKRGKAVVREGEWKVISSVGERFLLLMGGNCSADTKESGLLTRYLVPAFRWRVADACEDTYRYGKQKAGNYVCFCSCCYSTNTCLCLHAALSCTLFHHWILVPPSPTFTFLVCDCLICFSKTLPLFSGRPVSHRLLPLCSLPHDSYPASKGA